MGYIGNNLTVQQYAPTIAYLSGNGSTTVFTLPNAVVSAAQIIVVVANVVQNPSTAFTVSGTTLTFTSAPPSGTNNIWVEYISFQTNIVQPAAGTVTNSSFAPGASEFAAGTKLSFAQSAAPTGWAQDTSDTATNRMLRVVNTAGGGIGGSSSPILNNVVPSHTHGFSTGNQSADHSHTWGNWSGGVNSDHAHIMKMYGLNLEFNPGGPNFRLPYTTDGGYNNSYSNGASSDHAHYTSGTTSGMNVSHTHSGSTDNGSSQTNWTPRYIDLILCIKS